MLYKVPFPLGEPPPMLETVRLLSTSGSLEREVLLFSHTRLQSVDLIPTSYAARDSPTKIHAFCVVTPWLSATHPFLI